MGDTKNKNSINRSGPSIRRAHINSEIATNVKKELWIAMIKWFYRPKFKNKQNKKSHLMRVSSETSIEHAKSIMSA